MTDWAYQRHWEWSENSLSIFLCSSVGDIVDIITANLSAWKGLFKTMKRSCTNVAYEGIKWRQQEPGSNSWLTRVCSQMISCSHKPSHIQVKDCALQHGQIASTFFLVYMRIFLVIFTLHQGKHGPPDRAKCSLCNYITPTQRSLRNSWYTETLVQGKAGPLNQGWLFPPNHSWRNISK